MGLQEKIKARFQEREDLRLKLEKEYLKDPNNYKRYALFNKAWDLGHAAGEAEVEGHYVDLIGLIQ